MANEQNLIPLNKRSQRERKEIARKGAIASNKKQAENRTFKKELITLLNNNNGENMTNISVVLIAKALDGDVKAFQAIRDTIGEKPEDKLDLSGSISTSYEECMRKVISKDEY